MNDLEKTFFEESKQVAERIGIPELSKPKKINRKEEKKGKEDSEKE